MRPSNKAKHPDSQLSPAVPAVMTIEGAIVSTHSESGTSVPHVEEVHSGVLTTNGSTRGDTWMALPVTRVCSTSSET